MDIKKLIKEIREKHPDSPVKITEKQQHYIDAAELRKMAKARKEELSRPGAKLTYDLIGEIVANELGLDNPVTKQEISRAFKEKGGIGLSIIVAFLHATGTIFEYDAESNPIMYFKTYK